MTELKTEKKVEYLELIYDLIFVYVVGRNNSMLHHLENGFVSGEVFFAYILCTLAVIQIWNYSTFYINIYGRNDVREHVFLCINMFLLYFIADGTSVHWQSSVNQYCIAWALILVNIGVQYLIELRNHRCDENERKMLLQKAIILFAEAALVGVNMLVFALTGTSIAYVPILFGLIAMLVSARLDTLSTVDFPHLAERAMLYVVFTFGEMIIAVAPYFAEGISGNNLYFSLMAFLIVVGLFLSYGTLYNKILNRDVESNGAIYMTIHIFLIFALNSISAALEFMRVESVALMPKTLFLIGSFLLYYTSLFLTVRYAKQTCGFRRNFFLMLAAIAVSFVVLMLLFRNLMYVNIAVTVLYIFGIYVLIYRQGKFAETGSCRI